MNTTHEPSRAETAKSAMDENEQNAIVQALKESSTASISTVLYKQHGMRTRSLSGVQPLDQSNCRFAGPAYTLRFVPQREDLNSATDLSARDSKIVKAMEEIPAGAVLVLDMLRDASVGALGDVLVAHLIHRGVVGVVADGGMRDIKDICKLGMPVQCAGSAVPPFAVSLMPADVQTVVSCGGVSVFPGDFIIADQDGVVVIPAHIARNVAEEGVKKERQDGWVQKQVAGGTGVWGFYPPSEETLARYKATL